jgi:diguanylate cyclase (GGDEF)-like protein
MTTTDDITRSKDQIDALRADIADRDVRIASLEKTIDALHEELRCRDVDELTGMHNLRWLREFWSGLHRPAATIGAVAFLDIDLLKRVNDTYGHKVGNRVITHVAAVLISSGCYGVRYGGDEFILLIPSGWDVPATLDRIIDNIASCPIPTRTRDESITVVVSCGARVVEDGMDLHQMIHDADVAMYEVKRTRSGTAGCRVIA